MDIEPNNTDVEREIARLWRSYWANWLATRAWRILVGVALVVYGYGYRGKLLSLVTEPISTLSIADLGAIIGYAACGLGLVVGAIWMAFGPSWESVPSSRDAFRQQATEKRRRIETYHAKHPLLSRLRYPTLGVRPPWKAALIRLVICVALAVTCGMLAFISWSFSPPLSIVLILFTAVVMLSAVLITLGQFLFALAVRRRVPQS